MQDDLMYNKRWRKKPKYGYLVLFVVCIAILFAYHFSYKETVELKKCHVTNNCTFCHNRHAAMSAYFESKGSPDPHRMATAVLETSRPRLMASIAVRESRGNPKAVGDGGKSHGSFQVQKRHWGKVSNDPVEQALQSERILDELIAENNGNLRKALRAYNGEQKKNVYAQNILKELEFIP